MSTGTLDTPFPNLLSPLHLGGAGDTGRTLRCRVLMGSMHTGLEEAADGFRRMAAFYAERARGGVALIVTGGLSPNSEGNMWAGMRTMASAQDAEPHQAITDAVHAEGALVAVQLLHAGRYSTHAHGVAPSALKSPISPATPREMSEQDIQRTLDDYAHAAWQAQKVGYDGAEVMGAEGYLINQFATPRANRRSDGWGGSPEKRMRFAVEAVRRVRAATGSSFIVIYRLSMLDLVEGGSTWDEVVMLAKAVESAGASIMNPYVGWHEARVPTIASLVPRAAFVPLTARLKAHLRIPVVASNRINDPAIAEGILARGEADLVSMARPLLADPMFVRKAREGRAREINICIACNQGCLDEAFSGRLTGCMVNPAACRETELKIEPAHVRRRIAVVGAGPGGLACAATAAERGHAVTLFDAAPRLGGQFNLAVHVPGKEEYASTVRYFGARLARASVKLRLGELADADALRAGFDHVVLATGVVPRRPDIPGIEHPRVASYVDVLEQRVVPGRRVAIIGAGGIGFDVAEMLTHEVLPGGSDAERFQAQWGIDMTVGVPGGLVAPAPPAAPREIWLLQRKDEPLGRRLGKTTGWIRRALMGRRGVHMWAAVQYDRIDDDGLHLRVGGVPHTLEVDTIVICAGQQPRDEQRAPLESAGVPISLVGGARHAAELDATRAIDEGVRLAATL